MRIHGVARGWFIAIHVPGAPFANVMLDHTWRQIEFYKALAIHGIGATDFTQLHFQIVTDDEHQIRLAKIGNLLG